jgi:hypothetical protein
MRPDDAAPMVKPLAISVTMVTRRAAGAMSATMAMVIGTTAPRPQLATVRQSAIWLGPAGVHRIERGGTQQRKADDQHGRRPKRSASGLSNMAPIAMPASEPKRRRRRPGRHLNASAISGMAMASIARHSRRKRGQCAQHDVHH